MPSVLLTGFEPFGGSRINPSGELVKRLSAENLPLLQIHPYILPVDAARVPELLREALASLRPAWCIMLGQANGQAAISIERVAVNLCDFSNPDNAGHRAIDESIAPGGPAAYFATLPVRRMLDAVLAVDVPAELSLSAGAYLCNLVFYAALHICHTDTLATRCGFLHLPALPEQVIATGRAAPSMALDTACAGLRAILRMLATEADTDSRPLTTPATHEDMRML